MNYNLIMLDCANRNWRKVLRRELRIKNLRGQKLEAGKYDAAYAFAQAAGDVLASALEEAVAECRAVYSLSENELLKALRVAVRETLRSGCHAAQDAANTIQGGVSYTAGVKICAATANTPRRQIEDIISKGQDVAGTILAVRDAAPDLFCSVIDEAFREAAALYDRVGLFTTVSFGPGREYKFQDVPEDAWSTMKDSRRDLALKIRKN